MQDKQKGQNRAGNFYRRDQRFNRPPTSRPAPVGFKARLASWWHRTTSSCRNSLVASFKLSMIAGYLIALVRFAMKFKSESLFLN